ncbi:MAG: hypothetical protein V9G24_07290 [Rhodoblastus sp.]
MRRAARRSQISSIDRPTSSGSALRRPHDEAGGELDREPPVVGLGGRLHDQRLADAQQEGADQLEALGVGQRRRTVVGARGRLDLEAQRRLPEPAGRRAGPRVVADAEDEGEILARRLDDALRRIGIGRVADQRGQNMVLARADINRPAGYAEGRGA